MSRRAPCEPPVTSSVGRSGSRPKNARASARSAARSSCEIIRRIGSPTYSACGSGVSGKLTATRSRDPGAGLVGQAGQRRSARGPRAAACGGGRRGRPASRRSRRSRRPRRAGPGRGPPASRLTAPRSRAGHPEQVGVGPARQRHRRDQLERVAGLRDHAVLQAARRAQAGDLDGRVEPAQGVGGREQGRGVAGGATAGEENAHRDQPRAGSSGRGAGAGQPAPRRRRRAVATARRQRAGRLGLAAGEADEQAEGDQRGHQRGAAVGHQRQRDADDGQQGQHHADVDDHLAEQPDHDAEGRVAHERVGGLAGDPDRGVGDGEEQRDHQQGADQAELLAEHGEDEVGVRLGQVAPLLLAGADALAEPAAGRQRVEPVGRLPAGVVEVLERVGEVGDAAASRSELVEARKIADHADQRDAERRRSGRGRRPPRACPSRIAKSTSAVPRSWPMTTRPVASEQAGHHRHHHLVQAAEPAVLAGVDVGGPQDQGELGDLGGLDHDRAERQPVLVAVDVSTPRTGGQQPAGISDSDVARPGEPADPALLEPAGAPRAHGRPRTTHMQLALDHGVGVAVVVLERRDARGAQHHDQADGQQQRRGAEQQVVRRQRPVERLAQGGVPVRDARPDGCERAAPAVLGVRGRHLVACLLSVGLVSVVGAVAARSTAAAKASPRAA